MQARRFPSDRLLTNHAPPIASVLAVIRAGLARDRCPAGWRGRASPHILLAAYAEPQRHSHSQQHLGECLESLETVRDLAQRPAGVTLALWFYDAADKLRRGDKQQQRALWARRALQAAADEAVARVYELVMVTRHSQLPAAGYPSVAG